MRVVIGGAYSGKRQFIREQHPHAGWVSAYEHHMIATIEEQLSQLKTKVLVLEGFEKWIESDLDTLSDQELRAKYKKLLQKWQASAKEQNKKLYLILLEMGRGIVPIHQKERRLRDVMGWLQQDAVKLCDEAYYIWHGIAKQMVNQKEEGNHEATGDNSKTN